MLTTNTRTSNAGISNIAMGNVVTDGGVAADTPINCGFTPRYVMWLNKATMLKIEFYDGMAAGTGYRSTAGGAQTLDVAPAGITLGTPALGNGGTFTIKAADIPASSSFVWMAIG